MTNEIQMVTEIYEDPNHVTQMPTKIHGVILGNQFAKNSHQDQLSTSEGAWSRKTA